MKRNLLFSLLLTLTAGYTYAQTKITGKVTAINDGSVLPGVTVQVKGTSIGTQTDGEGKYSVAANKDQVLVFSFIGMDTKEVAVGNRSIVNISLAESENMLNEVVVLTALGLERKKDDDMSSSTLIDTDALKRSGEAGVIQGLSGKTSGLTVVRNSGDPGAGAYIQIRGQNTIFGSSSPLIILDGVPVSNSSLGGGVDGVVQQSRLNDINPDDIANVTILKGAAAAAVWGTGAANGVILIQTKRGNAGGKRVSVSVTNQTAWDNINREVEKQSVFGQGEPLLWRTGRPADAYTGRFTLNTPFSWGDKIQSRSGAADDVFQRNERFESDGGRIYYPILGKNSREIFNDSNRDQVFQTGFTWNKSVALNFNNDGSSTYLSFADWDQEGIIRNNSDYRRSTIRINNETRLTDKFKIRINSSFINTTANRIQQGSNLAGLYLGYLRTSPDFDNTDYKGTYYDASNTPFPNAQRAYRAYLGNFAAPNGNAAYNNPGWTVNEQENPNSVYRFIINPELNWNIYKGINLTARYGFDYYNDVRESFFPVNSAGAEVVGSFGRTEITERNESVNVFLNSTHVINKDVNFSWIAGFQAESLNFTSFGAGSADFTNPFVGDLRIFGNAEAANESPGLTRQIQRKSAGYAVVNAELFGQLYLEATGRYELPSTLNTPVFYPSVSAGWNFSKNIESNIFSFGKLRASYGQVGIEPSPYLNRTNFGSFDRASSWGDGLIAATYGNPFAQSSVAGNANLTRELVTEFEVGGDFRFLQDRVSLGVTYYNRTTKDALFPLSLPPASGFTNIWRNAAEISNKGIEIDAGVRLVKSGGFEWRIDANYSQNINIVESLQGSEFEPLAGFVGTQSGVAEGQPFGVIWGRRWLRDDQQNLVLDENGFPFLNEVNGPLGDPNPKWRGGLGTNISWKGLSLSAQFETFQGNQLWAGTTGILNFFGVSTESAQEIITQEELRTNDGRTVAAGTLVRGNVFDYGAGNVLRDVSWYVDGPGSGFDGATEQYIVDGSWTKLRELSLNYDIPAKIVSKLKLENASIGITGRNLFIWSPVKYTDPETNLTGASKGRGLEYFNNPGTESYMLTVKFGF